MRADSGGEWPVGIPDRIVYVIDDDLGMRQSILSLLGSVGLTAKEFESATEFLTFERPEVPSCLILDLRLKGQSGLTVQKELSENHIHIPVIFVSGHGDIAITVGAMKAGATDFITKPFRDQDLIDSVVRALHVDGQRRDTERSVRGLTERYEALTQREREVMALLVAGLRNKQIALQLCISEMTVKGHRGRAMRKMESRSFADFVIKANALGLVLKPNDNALQG